MKRKLSLLLALVMILSLVPMSAFAATTVGADPADAVTAGVSTAISPVVLTEAAAGDTTVGNIVLTAPAGLSFDTSSTPDVVVSGAGADLTVGVATVAAQTITIPVTGVSTTASVVTIGGVTPIKVVSNTVGTYVITVSGAGVTPATVNTVNVSAAAANRFATVASIDKTSVVADGTAKAEVTVYAYDQFNNPTSAAGLNLASNRGLTDTITVKSTVGNEKKFTITSNVPGTAKLAVGTGSQANIQKYLNGDITSGTTDAQTLGIVKEFSVNFTASGLENIVEVVASRVTNPVAPAVPVANGLDYFELSYKVSSASGAPVAGELVKFTASNSAVTFNVVEKETNAAGIAKVRVYSTKPGTYTVEAKAGSKSETSTVTFAENGLFAVEFLNADNQVVAKDSTKSFKFKLTDILGNKITVNAGWLVANGASVDVEAVDEPDDSSLSFTLGSYSDGSLKVTTSKLTEEGAYKLRVALPNGKHADVNFTVKKQGDVTSITLAYDETVIPYGTKSDTPTINRVDDAKVKNSVTLPNSDFEMISSDPSLVTVDANGQINATATTKDEIGQEVTITAIDKSNKLTASYTIKIGGRVVGFNAVAPEVATLVDDTAKVKVSFYDEKGTEIALGAASTMDLSDFVVVSKPEGAIVSVDRAADFAADLKAYGFANLEVSSNKAGDVKLQVIMADGATKYTQNVTVKFGTPAPVKPVYGVKDLTLTIGSKVGVADAAVVSSDFAPFIQDGRTFVPVRFIAEQLGAEVSSTAGADGRTQTVTLTREDLVVTMTMGSKDIVVVKDGVSSTVTSDVAAYVVAESGRTVLPFRALAEAMGATVTYGPEGGMVEWVKFVQ